MKIPILIKILIALSVSFLIINKPISVRKFTAFNEEYPYPNDYFKFKPGEKYKIVFKDLSTDPEIKHLRIYLGLDGAGVDSVYKVKP
ncbi:hypothetical protein ACFFHT_04790 [Gallibacterium melopsittaci]|uniref:Uncharacterized protein n=1 Tax=Gallibacterium melopsittaci TaxID=516063 RepID=A0ABV6HVV3_9PAST